MPSHGWRLCHRYGRFDHSNFMQKLASSFGTTCMSFDKRRIAHLSSLFSPNLSIHIQLKRVLLHLFDITFLHDAESFLAHVILFIALHLRARPLPSYIVDRHCEIALTERHMAFLAFISLRFTFFLSNLLIDPSQRLTSPLEMAPLICLSAVPLWDLFFHIIGQFVLNLVEIFLCELRPL